MIRSFQLFFFTLISFALAFSSYAQDPVIDQEGAEAASVVIYDTEFFSPYNPITAEDMIKRIPGTEGLVGGFGNQQDERRGLRANTDQILIDGKRLTGKENQSSSILEKLPANSVERIELITGNVRELDTAVGVRVINVVLKEDAGSGSGVAQIGFFYFPNGQVRPRSSLAYSGSSENLSYTASALLNGFLSPANVIDVITAPNGGRLSVIEETRRQDQVQYEARSTLTYSWPTGQTLSVNGFLKHFPRDNQDITTTLFDPGDAPLFETGTIVDNINGDDTTLEVSGDYAQSLGKSAKFTGLFLYSKVSVDRANKNFERLGEDLNQLGGDNKAQTATETIFRGTVDWNFAKRHDLEIGVEGAINTLNKDLDFFSVVNGEQFDIPIINSDQKITEDRVEAFSTHSWKPIDGLEIETGVAAEFSKLDQIGSDVSSQRSLSFVKPSLDIWYNMDNATQTWFSFRRDVGQLDFDDFVATVNREDNEVLAGNPDLAPEKSWDFEIGAERRLANGAGVLNSRVFYRRVNDVKDLIPFRLVDSQPGNLGSGNHYGAEAKASIRFGSFTDVDAVVNASILVQGSEVLDPFTGVSRRFGNQTEYKLHLDGRHYVQSLGLSYGFDINQNGPTIESDFNEFDEKSTTLDGRLFLEKTIAQGMILRIFWANFTELKNFRKRTLFAPSQADGKVDQIEFREQERVYVLGFRLRTTF